MVGVLGRGGGASPLVEGKGIGREDGLGEHSFDMACVQSSSGVKGKQQNLKNHDTGEETQGVRHMKAYIYTMTMTNCYDHRGGAIRAPERAS